MWSPCWVWESEIPDDICEKIISYSDLVSYKSGETQSGVDGGRKVDVKFLNDEFNWINAVTIGYVIFANDKSFNYKLSMSDKEGVQLSHYKVGQFYTKHVDYNGNPANVAHTRKLIMSIQLSDENSYEGGDLLIDYSGDTYHAPRSKGSVIVFDSRLTHEVTPVTRGERYSLVKWFHGDEPLR